MDIRKSIKIFVLFIASPAWVYSQSVDEQVWLEYMGNYPFANSFNFEGAFTYNTVLTSPKWTDYGFSATTELSISQVVEPMAAVALCYTNQTDSYNTFEVRPVIGSRFYLTPASRIQVRLLARFEQRNFKNLTTGEWTQAYRPRIRGELLIPINQDSYYKDNLWYGIVDAEAIFTTNDVKERFTNRFRIRTGIGYRLNYSLRFEFIYMLQESREAITDQFTSTDNIFRFRLKHYLRKSKPSQASGTGN